MRGLFGESLGCLSKREKLEVTKRDRREQGDKKKGTNRNKRMHQFYLVQ